MITDPFSQQQFRHPWRPYQARVLQAFEQHLADRHFHLVAAPGAGKTVLGLEVMRRLATPALILAPTLAIRDQWRQRWLQDFRHPEPDSPEHGVALSTDLEAPQSITISTYQGLHTAAKRIGMPALIERLQAVGIGCLVLDEAHHLRKAWWRCLDALKSALDQPWLIALTATPPFDVSAQEWNRYLGLCGPVDEEVPVPELVRAGTLCPHQDFLHLCLPTEHEQAQRQAFAQRVSGWLTALLLDRELQQALIALPLVRTPEQHSKLLVEHHQWALALTLYLASAAGEHAVALRSALQLNEVALPKFDARWAEPLFDGLFGQPGLLDPEHPRLRHWQRELRRGGALLRKRCFLRDPPRLTQQFAGSAAKVGAIAELIEHSLHSDSLGLRAAVLCDRIIESAVPMPGDQAEAVHRLGVVPVFEALRRRRLIDARLAVLTGSLLVLPSAALAALRAALPAASWDSLVQASYPPDPQFTQITPGSCAAGSLLAAFTQLFGAGELNILIGTSALLGEGWDAPALNTLIIASTSGASMSCNQMRGRAMRLDPQRAEKAARIWHLACVEPDGLQAERAAGPDLQSLSRRFVSFAGLSHDGQSICNGLARLGAEQLPAAAEDVARFNLQQRQRAADPHNIAKHWQSALGDPAQGDYRLRAERQVPYQRIPTSLWLRWLATEHRHGWLQSWGNWLQSRRLRRVAELLLQHLQQAGLISSEADARITVRTGPHCVGCRVDGLSRPDTEIFDQALGELFQLPSTPRYLIRYGGEWYPLPKALSGRRRRAERFAADWQRRLGRCQLLSTRSAEGRQALLAAKEAWLLSGPELISEIELRWSR